jgi:TatD DNase family protein
MIYDTHAHLEYFQNVEEVILNAKKNDISLINNICIKIYEFEKINNISLKFDNVFSSIGHHPCYINEIIHFTDYEIIEKYEQYLNINENKIIAIGEVGLDYYHNSNDQNIKRQKEILNLQLQIAKKYSLPVIIHTRNAEEDTYKILKNNQINGVIHCFTGSYEFMKKMLDLNFFISFSGITTFKNAKDLQNSFLNCPIEKALIETDSPYLAPEPFRGKKNEPAFLNETAKFLSNLIKKDFNEFVNTTTSNAKFLFNI